MKKNNAVFDVILLGLLSVLTAITIAPKEFIMPTSAQMVLLVGVLAAVSSYLVIVWRESPGDEREAENQYLASRYAYLVGCGVLVVAILYQGIKHDIDGALPLCLLAMIGTKLLTQRGKNNK